MGVLNGRKKDNGEIKQQCLIFRDRKREEAKQKGRELECKVQGKGGKFNVASP